MNESQQFALSICGVLVVLLVGALSLYLWAGARAQARRRAFAEHMRQEQWRRAEWDRQQQELGRQQQEVERQQRWRQLVDRFGDEVAGKIWAKRLWQGATFDMVREMLGPPEDIDETVLKTKTKHTLKYDQVAVNRYALRVMLEGGIVVGWDDKR